MLSEHVAHADTPPLPSNRAFGFLFVVVFLAVACAPYLRPVISCARNWNGDLATCASRFAELTPHYWALVISALFLVCTLVVPSVLSPLNRAWMAFGNLLHGIVSSLVLGILFFLVLAPLGILMRLFGRDALALRLDPEAASYWLVRDPPGPDPKSLPHQF